MKMSGKLHVPTDLTPEKEPPGTHWGGHQSGMETEEKNNLFPLSGIEPRPSIL
jgi:hypothetical protein